MRKDRLMRLIRLMLLLIVTGCLHAGYGIAAPSPNGILVVAPADNVWVTDEKLFVAGTVTGSEVKEVTISGVSVDASKGIVPLQEGGVFGTEVRLKKGMNTISFAAGSQKQNIQIFYTADKNKQAPPNNFKRFYLHSNPVKLNCKDCHRFKNSKFDFKKIIPTPANCTTGNCHSTVGKGEHVHGPVGAGVCISCHNPHGSTNPSFQQRTGPELCTVCHQARKEEFSQKVVHAPVEEGCVDCHDPHKSAMRFQLKADGKSVSALCFNCHEKAIFSKKFRHGPVDEGDCIACHRPHSSPNPSLLIASPKKGELCFECHEDRKAEFVMEYIHPPVAEDCSQCHDPHSSDAKFQLVKEGSKLCASCHEELNPKVYESINKATVKHAPVDQGQCPKCHRPHSSNYQALLQNSMEKLCLTCHTDLGDIIAESKNRHGPVQTGDCTACHNVHGSQFTKLLARYYPTNFYSEYGPQYYDLCFGCHNKDIAKVKNTTTLTNFRDGNYNLHFFHVNMKKGRTCTACHDAHASNQPKHIRYEVPFGSWSYPISFTKSQVGGTCVVGCHAPKTYDRQNPKINKGK